jgi:pentatricopeptide repeat protein
LLDFAMEDPDTEQYFWLDIFCRNLFVDSQDRPFEWWCSTFKDNIAAIGTVLLVMTPWYAPIPLTRAWCLWEIYCALELEQQGRGVQLILRLPADQRAAFLDGVNDDSDNVAKALAAVDAEKAQAHNTQDRENILGALRGSVGFAELSKAVSGRLRDWYTATAAALAEESQDAHALNQLGNVVWQFGQLDDALGFYLRSLDITLAVLGDMHPETAATYNNIANAYDEQSQPGKALEYHHKALAIKLARFGENLLATSATYNNMARAYLNQGEFDEALACRRKALDIRLVQLGEMHPDTAFTYSGMADVFRSQGHFHTALEYYNKALYIRLATLGDKHHDTATTFGNVGVTHLKMGDRASARPFLQRCVDVLGGTLGPDHARTKGFRQSLEDCV